MPTLSRTRRLPSRIRVALTLALAVSAAACSTWRPRGGSVAEAPTRGPRRDFGGGGGRFGGGDRFGGGGYRDRDAGPSGPMVEGKVKFFNEQKGFGFVMPDSGSGDIYLHASALRRSGISTVEPDQRIRYSTRQGNKGVEVDRVEII